MNILVTGATGFTGSYVVPRLLARGYQVRCLVRHSSHTALLPVDQITLVSGDLNDPDSLLDAFQGCDTLVNIASLGSGYAPHIVQAAIQAGIQRAIFISTTAIFTSLNAPSKRIRLAAEQTICQSGLSYTILRPTMIYGSARDRNMCRLINYLRRWPVIPIFGSGTYLQQPVYVADVADAVVQALASSQSIGKAYNIAGSTPLTYNQVIDTTCKLLGRNVRKIHLPIVPITATLKIIENLAIKLPLKAEQIQRLNEHKAFDFMPATEDFGYQPHSFESGLRLELKAMGLV